MITFVEITQPKMDKKKILVTGGAGFIGSNLCARLLDEGHEVICLDNLFSSSINNIKPLLKHPNFHFLNQDIEQPIEWNLIGLDQIYNLACPASPIHYQYDSVKTIRTSVLGAIHMLDIARKTGATILQASTSEVYGDPMVHPQVEGYWGNVNPLGERSCYDEGKRCAESLFMNYHKQYNLNVKIIRIFNTYGPHMLANDGRVVSNFIVQALKGEPITIYGDGSQTRSFQYIDDLLEGMIRMMNDTPDSFTGPVNIGNPGEYTILELAKMVIEMTGSKSEIVMKPLPKDDPTRRRPDITLAQEKLGGWEPKVKVQDGLQKTIDYFKSKMV